MKMWRKCRKSSLRAATDDYYGYMMTPFNHEGNLAQSPFEERDVLWIFVPDTCNTGLHNIMLAPESMQRRLVEAMLYWTLLRAPDLGNNPCIELQHADSYFKWATMET
jgi:hypothetical protein